MRCISPKKQTASIKRGPNDILVVASYKKGGRSSLIKDFCTGALKENLRWRVLTGNAINLIYSIDNPLGWRSAL